MEHNWGLQCIGEGRVPLLGPLGILGITRAAGMKHEGCRVGGDEGYAGGEGSLQCAVAATLEN